MTWLSAEISTVIHLLRHSSHELFGQCVLVLNSHLKVTVYNSYIAKRIVGGYKKMTKNHPLSKHSPKQTRWKNSVNALLNQVISVVDVVNPDKFFCT